MTEQTYFGNQFPDLTLDNFNRTRLEFENLIKNMYTSLPVKVVAVKNSGLSPVGYVDIQPIVQQATAGSNLVDYPLITNAPYFRLQGGKNAIVIDPHVGDIGTAIFSSRDITSAKRIRGTAPPGSLRKFDLSDAIYTGGILNGTPVQFAHFKDDGIDIISPFNIKIQAPTVTIDASSSITLDSPIVQITGQISQTGAKGSGASMQGGITNTGGTISSNGIVLDSHKHGGVQTGGGETGGPV